MDQLLSIFDVKYSEFAKNLLEAIPELDVAIRSAAALSPAERLTKFKEEVLPALKPNDLDKVRCVLPGVVLSDKIWSDLGSEGQGAIKQFLGVLAVCSSQDSAEWSKEFFEKWKESMSSIDFNDLSAKLAAFFGDKVKMPKIPEKLLKGQLAKFAEEILREFKPEEFGFTKEMMEEAEKNPEKAFKLITDVYTKNPEALQKSMKRIVSRLQDKIRRGQFNPHEMRKEIEELMKELTENSEFKGLITALKASFGFAEPEDPDFAVPAARGSNAARDIARERMRKKHAAKQAAKNRTQ